ncbi:MAG: UDP-glucose 4-epimerase GalE [Pseudomonadota bacterium]
MTQKILLTGGAGYIGSHTYAALSAAGHRAVILDDFSNARRSVTERLGGLTGAPVTIIDGDVNDAALLARIFAGHAIDAVIHFAAKKAVGESVAKPLDYAHVNIGGLTTLMQAMAAAGVFRLVFSSSATVYGDNAVPPTPEDAPLSWSSPYAFTKVACETILRQAMAAEDRWQIGILRYFNPVGAHPSGLIGEDPADIPNNLMPFIAKVATGELPEIRVFGNDYDTPDGTGLRDYIHVMDLARGHVLSLEALARTGESHLVNLGTGRAISVLEMIAAYSGACGRDLPYRIAPRRPGDVTIYQANAERAADLLGFRTELDLDAMCTSSWHWIQSSHNWRMAEDG